MTERPAVSVITIAYNRPGTLTELLESIRQTGYPRLEIVVVNNSDATYRTAYEDVVRRYPGLTHLWNGANLLISGALNRGIAAARGELLLCCGDDNLFDREMISRLAEFMKRAKDVAVAGPVIYFATGDGILTAGHAISLSSGLPSNTRTVVGDDIDVEIVDDVFMIRASVLEEIGGFDERNFPFYLESADLCARARRHGYRCATVAAAKAYHKYVPLTAGVVPDPDRYGDNADTYYYLFKTKIRYIGKYGNLRQRLIFFSVFLPLLALWHGGIVAIRSRQRPAAKLTAILRGIASGIFGSA